MGRGLHHSFLTGTRVGYRIPGERVYVTFLKQAQCLQMFGLVKVIRSGQNKYSKYHCGTVIF